MFSHLTRSHWGRGLCTTTEVVALHDRVLKLQPNLTCLTHHIPHKPAVAHNHCLPRGRKKITQVHLKHPSCPTAVLFMIMLKYSEWKFHRCQIEVLTRMLRLSVTWDGSIRRINSCGERPSNSLLPFQMQMQLQCSRNLHRLIQSPKIRMARSRCSSFAAKFARFEV